MKAHSRPDTRGEDPDWPEGSSAESGQRLDLSRDLGKRLQRDLATAEISVSMTITSLAIVSLTSALAQPLSISSTTTSVHRVLTRQ